jgi:ABC-type sugar transport system permease subunit
MNNVIMEKNPVFVGVANYVELVTDKVFQQAVLNTMYFTIMSVMFHLILGLTFAILSRCLRFALGLYRDDHCGFVATHVKSKRHH